MGMVRRYKRHSGTVGEYNMVISSCVWYGASMEMPLVDTYTDSVYYCVLYVHVNMPGIKQDKASRYRAV